MARGQSRTLPRRQITTLAGGVGAAKFIRGLVRRIDPARLTVVVNTGDDETFYGLHVSPDIDTVTYTLAGAVNRAQGWGLDGESFNVLPGARALLRQAVVRSRRSRPRHASISHRPDASGRIAQLESPRKSRTHSAVKSRILPMSDDRVRTFVKLRGRRAIPFQEYFVRGRARGVVEKIELRGIATRALLPRCSTRFANPPPSSSRRRIRSCRSARFCN